MQELNIILPIHTHTLEHSYGSEKELLECSAVCIVHAHGQTKLIQPRASKRRVRFDPRNFGTTRCLCSYEMHAH